MNRVLAIAFKDLRSTWRNVPALMMMLAAPLALSALLGFAFGAAGLFASSLSRNQVVAFVAAFLACFVLFILGKSASLLPGALGSFAEYVGIDSHLENLAKGVLDTRDLAYFLSLIFAFLYLTVQRLRARRF